MYESFYDKLKPSFGEKDIQYHYIDTDAFVLGLNTMNNFEVLKNLIICFLLAI